MKYNGKMISLLYVDDEPANLFLFEASFQSSFKVHTASSGSEGLAILDDHMNDIMVVITDMRMPKMNGIEFVREAKSKHKDAAYFILTGFDFNADIEEAIEEGLIIKYFTKPFDQNLIRSYIEEFVSALS
ncbi:MAG: response regulator [Cyclobacteriaceae bacterium]|jgi:response regulator RpfG family c-di-GMP phosphodiesterase